jgi:hypothetical protein
MNSSPLSAFDILRQVATQSIMSDTCTETIKETPVFFKKTIDTTSFKKKISALNGSFVDMHFAIRKEMYLKFCLFEEQGLLTNDQAQFLRTLIYPTSERFHDIKFVYLVNQDLPPTQLITRLLELEQTNHQIHTKKKLSKDTENTNNKNATSYHKLTLKLLE